MAYHFCAFASIVWRSQIVEGKDRPTQLGPKKWEKLGNTVGLMIRMRDLIFQLVSVLCLTMDFVCQRGSQPFCSLASTLLRSPISANTGPRLYPEMPLTNTFLKKCYLCGYVGGHK